MDLKRGPIPGLPDSTLSDCLFLTAKRGQGKSYTMRLAMERALSKRMRCGWVDSMGVGWGITLAANGKDPGFDVVVFGGKHAHIPISDGTGAALGATLAKASFSWVLDLTTIKSKAKRVAFMAAFGEALYENCSEPLLLFMDEVDLWAPQTILDKQGPAAAMLGVMHEIVRRGRIKGLTAWMATQRPAEVSKGIISQADAMLTLKLMAPQDLDAATNWLKGNIGKVKAAEWSQQIPTLAKGEAIVYLTEPDISIERIQFGTINTLDTFKPPKKGEKEHSGRGMSKPDLDAIKAQLGDVEAELKANDPTELHKHIAALERELRKKQPPATSLPAGEIEKIKAEARAEGYEIGYRTHGREIAKQMKLIGKHVGAASESLKIVQANMQEPKEMVVDVNNPVGKAIVESGPARPGKVIEIPKAPKPSALDAVRIGAPPPELGAEKRILKVLASRYPAKFTEGQWATLAGMKKNGGTWKTYRSRLNQAGYILKEGNQFTVTAEGLEACGGVDLTPQTVEEVQDMWCKSVGGASKILRFLIDMYPAPASPEFIAENVEMTHTGGTFKTYMSKLRSNGLIVKDGHGERAADILFQEG